MAVISNPVIWLVVGAAWLVLLGVTIWRMRRVRAQKGAAEQEEREAMLGRLAQMDDVQPLSPPPSIYTRPEERWTRPSLPSKRRPKSQG